MDSSREKGLEKYDCEVGITDLCFRGHDCKEEVVLALLGQWVGSRLTGSLIGLLVG